MASRRRTGRDLREACVTEALAIIAERGVEELSLREVARRLDVSHQAPYKHFPNRDALLAEVVARAFAAFAAHLDDRPRHEDPAQDLASLGHAYLAYADAHPLDYRLMFATPLPDPAAHPAMLARARHAFSVTREVAARLGGRDAAEVELDALFVWSLVHGIAGLRVMSAVGTLELGPDALARLEEHAARRLGRAFGPGGAA